MMHPNDYEKLIFIIKCFLVGGIITYSIKIGRDVRSFIYYGLW